MRSILNTIPADAPFMYQQQGYGANYITGTPIADGGYLLPFVSRPMAVLEQEVIITGTLLSICGNYSIPLGVMPSTTKNNTLTVYWNAAKDTGVTPPQGYYYILIEAIIVPEDVATIVDDYVTRVEADGGTVEAVVCLAILIEDLRGDTEQEENIYLDLIKTEPFWMPAPSQAPDRKGSFNQSFDQSFDV